MASIDNPEELQKVATYWAMPKALKSGGIGSIIFGLIALFVGGSGFSENALNGALFLLGVVLIAEGIWLIVKPVPAGFIVDGSTVVLVGVWNIFVGVLNSSGGDSGGARWVVFGLFQIYLGIKNIRRYKEFANLPKPSGEDLQRMVALLKTIKDGSLKQTPDLIEFRRRSFLADHPWKARLFDNVGVFVNTKVGEALIVKKSEIQFTPTGKVLLGKTRKCTLRIGPLSSEGMIHPDSLARFESWKLGQIFVPAPLIP